MATRPTQSDPTRSDRLINRLARPVGPTRPDQPRSSRSRLDSSDPTRSDQADPTRSDSAPAGSDRTRPTRKLTAAERSARHQTNRIAQAEAAGNPAALLIAWTDRIRAAKDPVLARKAATLLASLYESTTNSRK